MLSRRRFLGYSVAGMVTTAAGCRPTNFNSQQDTASLASSYPLINKKSTLASKKHLFLGYPLNMNTPPEEFFAWRKELKQVGIGDFGFNNVGNPYTQSSIEFNCHDFERDIIARFSKIHGFPSGDTWGFLSHSGTDSNMHGMYMGRKILEEETHENAICYFTKEAHYSIQILSDLLGMKRIFVKTLSDAGIDTTDLKDKLMQHPNNPALVVATVGTTFKGAIDSIDAIQKVLSGTRSYLHVDAALFGGYLPHTLGKGEILLQSGNPRNYRYDSIAISCHKFFGFPSPAGLFITTQTNFNKFHEAYSKVHNPEYIGHVPGTITCSRDAVKPAEFYFFSESKAISRQAKDARLVLENTDFLYNEMKLHFEDLMPTRSNHLSNTIYFKNPGKQIVKKYSLATMHLNIDESNEDFAHVVVMPHATKKVLSEFLDDLSKKSMPSIG